MKMKMKMKIRKRKRNDYSKENRIAILLYSTISRVPVVSYCTTPCWNSYANKNICYCLLGGYLCSWCTWMNEGKTFHPL